MKTKMYAVKERNSGGYLIALCCNNYEVAIRLSNSLVDECIFTEDTAKGLSSLMQTRQSWDTKLVEVDSKTVYYEVE